MFCFISTLYCFACFRIYLFFYSGGLFVSFLCRLHLLSALYDLFLFLVCESENFFGISENNHVISFRE